MRTKPSRTAQYVAQARFVLTSNGVIDDPYAAAMLTWPNRIVASVLAAPALRRVARSPFFGALATRITFFDREVVRAVDAGVFQVVTLGAGYDARPWRFAHEGVVFFEVDHPATQADKQRRAPAGGPVYVAVDFRVDNLVESLTGAGFQWTAPALFVIEGVTMYLSESEVRATLSVLAQHAAPQGRLAVNFAAPPGAGGRQERVRQSLLRRLGAAGGEPHVFFAPLPEATRLVEGCGWAVVGARSLHDLATELLGQTTLRIGTMNDLAGAVTAVLGQD